MASNRRKSSAVSADERVRRTRDESRDNRASMDDPRTEDSGLALTEAERQALSLDEWTQRALPTPPKIQGFHLCWLSMTNQWDPIARRVRLGYVPVKAEEVKGFEYLKLTSGEHAGCIGVNEMVLFKIPERVYQVIMKQFHHDMPREEEEKIRARVDSMMEAQDKTGRELVTVVGDGLKHIVDDRRPRQFD